MGCEFDVLAPLRAERGFLVLWINIKFLTDTEERFYLTDTLPGVDSASRQFVPEVLYPLWFYEGTLEKGHVGGADPAGHHLSTHRPIRA